MRIARFEFAPAWWAVMLFLAVFAVLLWLGTWQWQRGDMKSEIIAERAAAGKMAPQSLAQTAAPKSSASAASGRLIVAHGEYDAQQQLLLDNQVWQGRAGYHVWTPLRRANGEWILVDRGWVPLGADRANPPRPSAPTGNQRVVGYLRPWPLAGLALGGNECGQSNWPRVVNYPDFKRIACHYQAPVFDGLLLLREQAEGGFPRDWQTVGLPPQRHYGYAFQWYALAATLLVIFIGINTRKRSRNHDPK